MSTYLVAARRTPIAKLLGGLSSVPAPHLAAVAMRAALADTPLRSDEIDHVILGHVLPAGVGQAPARQAALSAGLLAQVGAMSVNKVCGSGLMAVMLADQMIRAGEAQAVIAGGMESMSRTPHLLLGSRTGWKYGNQPMVDSLLTDGLWCAHEDQGMGTLADATAESLAVSREDQDAFALESHRRAAAAWETGKFSAEVVPVAIKTGKSDLLISRDEGPRAGGSLADLAKLRPAFAPTGTATAGNASQISDGAAAVIVAGESLVKRRSTSPMARIVATATVGGPPRDLFIAPIAAIRAVLAKADLKIADIDLFELNEAFASQVLVGARTLEIDLVKLNVHGGAIALGHPIGASGARVLVTLLHALVDRQKRLGLAALCLGGGEAVAVIVERLG